MERRAGCAADSKETSETRQQILGLGGEAEVEAQRATEIAKVRADRDAKLGAVIAAAAGGLAKIETSRCRRRIARQQSIEVARTQQGRLVRPRRS